MKKGQLFAVVLALSVFAGSVTAFGVYKALDKGKKADVIYTGSDFTYGTGNHFTSYEPQKYPDLTYAAENTVKGVVYIEIEKEVQRRSRGGYNPFEEFFGFGDGGFGGQGDNFGQPQIQRGSGSGVIISPDGYIVTNNHVVEGASKVKVTLNDGRILDADVIGTDPATDIALVKVAAADLPCVPFGDSDALRLGEWVLAIGYPYGLQNTITAGIVSGKARQVGAGEQGGVNIESFIQTDAVVNRGNSGGALVNTAGQLVGINTLIRAGATGDFIGYSFAVPSVLVQKVVVDLKEHGVVQRGWLGVTMQQIRDGKVYDRNGDAEDIGEKAGIYIVDLLEDGAAEAAGIRKGDIITAVDGVEILTSARLQEEVAKHRPNDKITISIKRDGEVKQIDVVLRNQSGNTNIVSRDTKALNDILGGTFADLSEQGRKRLKIDGGAVVVSLREGGLLDRMGVPRNFVVTEIDGKRINSAADLNRVAAKVTSIKGMHSDGTKQNYSLIAE